MSLFLKIAASSDRNSSSISVCCFCWTSLSLGVSMLARGGGRQRMYCFIYHATPTHPLPPKKGRGNLKKRAAGTFAVIHVHYPQPTTPLKPLNSLLLCSCSSSGGGQHHPVLRELVIWFKADLPACLALHYVIPVNSVFKWLQANWYHLSGKAPLGLEHRV